MKKRLLSILLVLCMVLALLPGTAWAVVVDSGTCGDNLTWTLTDDGTLTISGTGPMTMTNYTHNLDMPDGPWAEQHDAITAIVISNGVTSIGNYAFRYCWYLTSVTIPDSVTSIGQGAFSGTSLANVVIPNSITSIGDEAFESCSLTSVTIPDSVTSIGYGTFSYCLHLTSVTIPSSVTSIEAFAFNHTGLTDVYYGGSENQWKQIAIDYSTDNHGTVPYSNDPLLNATIHYNSTGAEEPAPTPTPATSELSPAVKYVYYSEELPGSWQANANSLPGWLSADGNVLYGMPMEAGEYPITLSDGSETRTVTLTVRENGDNSVRASISEGYLVVQDFPDIIDGEATWIIDEVEKPAPGEPDIFDRLLDVYLDGRKLTGGKLEEWEQAPDDWEYYARLGSAKITIREQAFSGSRNQPGTHTISANFASGNGGVSPRKAVDTVSTNIYFGGSNAQTGQYPFTDIVQSMNRDAIVELAKSGVVNGVGNDLFRPQDGLTRSQACAILARATGNGNASGTAPFSDTSGHWAEGAIAWCASKGIVSGYGDGKFGPDDPLTGYAWSKMLYAALGFDATALTGSSWEKGVMDLLYAYGLDRNMRNFYPEQTIRREQTCQLVYNAFVQKLISV